jgi:hypothetical protein
LQQHEKLQQVFKYSQAVVRAPVTANQRRQQLHSHAKRQQKRY